MNKSSSDILLQKKNDEIAILLIPAMVFIGVLMLTGVIGNIAVCYFYGCKTKTTPTSCFILGLAIFDLLSCTISMPMEILDLRFFYMYPDITVCKVLTATNFLFALASVLILIAIATERYRRICLPFRRQITVVQARFICCSSVPISCIFSWPFLLLYTVVPINVPLNNTVNITGYDCTTVLDESLKVYLNALNIMQILLFIFTLVPLIVLYILVYRQIIKLKQIRGSGSCEDSVSPKQSEIYNRKYNLPTHSNANKDTLNSSDQNTMVKVCNKSREPSNYSKRSNNIPAQVINESMDNIETTTFMREKTTNRSEHNCANNEESLKHNEEQQANILAIEHDSEDDLPKLHDQASGTTNNVIQTNDRNRDGFEHSSNKLKFRFTKLMVVITVVFVASFIPYLCLVVWRSLSSEYVVTNMTDLQLIFYVIGLRSFFLNSAVNPMIYGFFNSKFRHFFANVCCDCCGSKSRYNSDLETTSPHQSNTAVSHENIN
ncbi:hypothetical protein ACJMK2_000365 [Sinanodonta woodiana]|uniref:G-protein coupled receptors family 1 profile domain-containing protein n=1 Tax=Sinanodonta woodiana TaxID=1069815 RepID=A0ABD3XSK0_SINWO